MELENPFLRASDNLEKELIARDVYRSDPCTFGVDFLDHGASGAQKHDVIVVVGKQGGGKTEFASQMALANILKGKRVHYFALEAEPYEIERRVKYRMLTDAFYMQVNWKDYKKNPSYRAWIEGRNDELLKKFEPEVDEILKEKFKNLFMRYRIGSFTAETFSKEVQLVALETDLIIIDHFHYFDFENLNENRAMKDAVKIIRDTALLIGKPVVVLAQLRKTERGSSVLPSMDDIHGSSDIAKMATKIIIIASARDQVSGDPHIYPTYMHIAKNRIEGSVERFIGIIGYDIKANKYQSKYTIGQKDFGDEKVKILEYWDYPDWAQR